MGLAALVVITCSATRERAPSTPAPSPGVASVAPPPAPSSAPVAAASSAPPATSAAPSVVTFTQLAPSTGQGDPLARFRAALGELAEHRRSDHVRILWLGDSHTASDLWTGPVRRALQERYGDGGPGFVHAGWGVGYRHDRVRVDAGKRWRPQPGDYARQKRYDDGVLGLGGVRLVPTEPGARTAIEARAMPPGAARWELAYRLPDGSSLRVTPEGGPGSMLVPRGDHGVKRLSLRTASDHRVTIEATAGKPQLLGLVVEATEPGVVLDTVGLNGARVGTFLAYDTASWQDEVARRHPDLVVLAFGTNETSDPSPEPARYERQLTELLRRVHTATPGAACLVILPVDRAGAEYPARLAAISEGFTLAASAAGCATWSALAAMGGPGSMATWSAEPSPRGGADGVHLTARGYGHLGEAMARELLRDAPAPARRGEGTSTPTQSPLVCADRGSALGRYPDRQHLRDPGAARSWGHG